SDEALSLSPNVIAAACPFCNTMLTDGVKNREKENEVAVMDIAEIVAASME
ncbi:MAG: (Fe-S)-binding protein, partial [Chitinophagaceae bacterium]|nr:(Fe-S)-binding protein [Chitinophagaceae bacterium]